MTFSVVPFFPVYEKKLIDILVNTTSLIFCEKKFKNSENSEMKNESLLLSFPLSLSDW